MHQKTNECHIFVKNMEGRILGDYFGPVPQPLTLVEFSPEPGQSLLLRVEQVIHHVVMHGEHRELSMVSVRTSVAAAGDVGVYMGEMPASRPMNDFQATKAMAHSN
jgi:hypothetical protein